MAICILWFHFIRNYWLAWLEWGKIEYWINMVLPWPLSSSKMAASATASSAAPSPLDRSFKSATTTFVSSSPSSVAAPARPSYSSRSKTPRSSRNLTSASTTLKEIETPPSSGSETEIDFLMDVPVKSRWQLKLTGVLLKIC